MSPSPSYRSSALPRSSSLFFPLLLAAVGGAGLVAAFFYATRSPAAGPSIVPHAAAPPELESPTLPLPPPVALTADRIDAFIEWVAAVPVGDAQTIRNAVAAARGDDAVHTALIDALFLLPATDFGRHLLLLSVIGELRHPDAAAPLLRFLHLPGDAVIPKPQTTPTRGTFTSSLDYSAGLQARAAEMLAHLRTPEALAATLNAAAVHSSPAVRRAALDAYVYNHDDSPEAHDRARAAALPHEAKLVGLPRRTRDMDPEDFNRRVLAFYQQHPSEVPPRPHASQTARPAPPTPGPTAKHASAHIS